MNVSAHPPFPAVPPPAAHRRRARRGAFALVLTLLILSLLIIVAVSYLSSMVSERQTADAYTSKARAEQVAQAGVDSAMAILTESFRDYPDSATVWDAQQSQNSAGAVAYNEGASLYLRAMPDNNNPALSATPSPGATPGLANDPSGNNPCNPACQTFVLPLVSGVPGGRAQLVSQKSAILPAMNVSVTDPAKQNFADLNVRRYAGDTQGVIGSPPSPGSTPPPTATPKPARALWVNLKTPAKDSNGNPLKDSSGNPLEQSTGRYAFWMEDESFRANSSFLGANTARPDNRAQPTPSASATPGGSTVARPLQPGDLTLVGPLTQAGDGDPNDDALAITNTRLNYPGNFFPDPLAFAHALPASTSTPTLADKLRYLTTNQSGTLNLTRHGTQRLNLNGIFPKPTATTNPETPPAAAVTQSAVDQIVQTLKFHLPDFGQRFYRTSTDTSSATLNAKQVAATGNISDPATIYLYKVAANICDYLDTDSQPTMILAGGTVDTTPVGYGTSTLNDDQSTNTYWAQGKESSPLIQEVVVRYRPIVGTTAAGSPLAPHDFDLQVDYYIEFWNMTDRDIYATKQSGALSAAPHLNDASVFVREQQGWAAYAAFTSDHTGGVFTPTGDTQGLLLPSNGSMGPLYDWQIDLSSSAVRGYDPATKDFTTTPGGQNNTQLGVVFRAGTVTVITTDPDCFKDRSIPNYSYQYISPYSSSALSDNSDTVHTYPANVFFCPVVAGHGQREYRGHIQVPTGSDTSEDGMTLSGEFYTSAIYSGTEVSLANNFGYLDLVRGAITKVKHPTGTPTLNYFYTITWKNKPPNNTASDTWRNDYSFGSALMGNVAEPMPKSISTTGIVEPVTPSELGDPRTNNEQLQIAVDPGNSTTANNSDGSHYMPGKRTLGLPNGVTVQPDLTAARMGWGDYFAMPTGSPYPNADATNAPAVVGDGPLTSIGQLGDVYDPARVQGPGGIVYSRGGGRTFKIGQHDDLYSFDPTGSASPNNTVGFASASSGWASWRLADVFSIDDSQELPARININGVARDQGAALLAALNGWTFQPTTPSGAATDPTIHGDGHAAAGLANLPLDTGASSSHGAAQIINLILKRLGNATPSLITPNGPFFERGELSELGADTTPIFGVNPAGASPAANTALVAGVDMNKTFDHGREEMFRRLSELICTRGDTFTVYAVGQAITQAPITNPANPPPMKVTGTHRLRVTFRLVPQDTHGNDFAPTAFDGGDLTSNPISAQVAKRFSRPDHYNAQVLEVNAF